MLLSQLLCLFAAACTRSPFGTNLAMALSRAKRARLTCISARSIMGTRARAFATGTHSIRVESCTHVSFSTISILFYSHFSRRFIALHIFTHRDSHAPSMHSLGVLYERKAARLHRQVHDMPKTI